MQTCVNIGGIEPLVKFPTSRQTVRAVPQPLHGRQSTQIPNPYDSRVVFQCTWDISETRSIRSMVSRGASAAFSHALQRNGADFSLLDVTFSLSNAVFVNVDPRPELTGIRRADATYGCYRLVHWFRSSWFPAEIRSQYIVADRRKSVGISLEGCFLCV